MATTTVSIGNTVAQPFLFVSLPRGEADTRDQRQRKEPVRGQWPILINKRAEYAQRWQSPFDTKC